MIGFLIAQVPTPAPPPTIAPLLRRFFQSGLAQPPGSIAYVLLALIAALVLFAVVAGLLQRDWNKWLRGLFDVRGHFEQIGAGLEIIRRNKRPLWVTLVAAVISWSVWALKVWRERTNIADIESMLQVHGNSAASFAWSNALAASLAPLRDLLSLGDLLPLAIIACLVLFARTAEISQHLRTKTRAMENVMLKRRVGTIWVAMIVLVAYRVIGFTMDPVTTVTAPTASGCLYIDALLLPVALLVADGMLLSWVLAEYGRGVCGRFEWDSSDTAAFARGIPAAMCACGLANLGRYLALGFAMWEQQSNSPTKWSAKTWEPLILAASILQVIGLVWFAFPAVLAVERRGRLKDKFSSFVTLLRRAGGKVVGFTVLGLVLNMAVVVPFYWIFGKMQAETWSLVGAASYGHYATLLLGLVLLAGATQLAHLELGFQEDPGPAPIQIEETAAQEQWVVVE